eukprot:gene9596-biopygen184
MFVDDLDAVCGDEHTAAQRNRQRDGARDKDCVQYRLKLSPLSSPGVWSPDMDQFLRTPTFAPRNLVTAQECHFGGSGLRSSRKGASKTPLRGSVGSPEGGKTCYYFSEHPLLPASQYQANFWLACQRRAPTGEGVYFGPILPRLLFSFPWQLFQSTLGGSRQGVVLEGTEEHSPAPALSDTLSEGEVANFRVPDGHSPRRA